MEFRRWTPLTFLFPGRYVSRDPLPEGFDIEEWSREAYEWDRDPWNGLRDFARRPAETLSRGRGDCEDYALVAAPWAVVNGREGVGLAFCFAPPHPWPTHAVAYDAQRVYSSGRIHEKTVEQWVADSDTYAFSVSREVT